MKARHILTKDEILTLTAPSDRKGWEAIAFDWLAIAGAFAAVVYSPHILTVILAMVIIGGRQLGFGILVHECAHRSLFKTKWLNDWAGWWLCGVWIWQDLSRYREHHLRHHQLAGTPQDPDRSLVSAFPVSKRSLFRKLLRDLVGITGLKRIYGLWLMDLGYLKYTVAAEIVPLPQTGRTRMDGLKDGLKHLGPVILAQLILMGILTWIGRPWMYLLWIGSYLTTFSAFLRIRSIAEHACTQINLDPRLHTRTTRAGFLARMTVAPHAVNYHLEHHVLMSVPYFRLHHFFDILEKKGLHQNAYVQRRYLAVLAEVCK